MKYQLNDHFARCDNCGERLKEMKYIWDVIGGKMLCKECWDRRHVEVPENIMDAFINFFHLPR